MMTPNTTRGRPRHWLAAALTVLLFATFAAVSPFVSIDATFAPRHHHHTFPPPAYNTSAAAATWVYDPDASATCVSPRAVCDNSFFWPSAIVAVKNSAATGDWRIVFTDMRWFDEAELLCETPDTPLANCRVAFRMTPVTAQLLLEGFAAMAMLFLLLVAYFCLYSATRKGVLPH